MSKDIALIIVSLITAISTLIAVYLTGRSNLKISEQSFEAQNSQRTKERRIEKIENIYLLFEKWEAHMDSMYLYYLNCCNGVNKYKDMGSAKFGILEPNDFQKLEVLINIYTQEAIPKYNEVVKAREKILDYMIINPEQDIPDLTGLHESQNKFKEKCNNFKSILNKILNNLI